MIGINFFPLATVAGIAASLLAGAAPASDEAGSAAESFKPVGDWRIDHGNSKCTASKRFAGDDTTALFSLELRPISSTAWLKVGFAGAAKMPRDDGNALMFIDGRAVPGRLHVNIFDTSDHRVQEYMLDLERHDLGSIEQSLRLQTGKRHRDFQLELPRFKEVWAAMQGCMDDLYAALGISRAELQRVVKPARGHSLKAVPLNIWPKDDFDLVALYWVDEKGSAHNCRLLELTESERFNAEYCELVEKRGRFAPALDASGKPVRAPVLEIEPVRTISVSH